MHTKNKYELTWKDLKNQRINKERKEARVRLMKAVVFAIIVSATSALITYLGTR